MVLHRHVTVEGHNLGASVVTVLGDDLGKFLTDDRALTLRRGQDRRELVNHRLKLVVTVNQLLALESRQTTQLHVEDRLRLEFIDAQQLHQAVTCDLDRGGGADQGNNLIKGVKGLEQPTQDVGLLLGLAQPERRPSPDDIHLVLDPVADERAQRQCARHTVNQRQHVGAEGGLQLGVFVKVVEYDLGNGVTLEHDHQPLAGPP